MVCLMQSGASRPLWRPTYRAVVVQVLQTPGRREPDIAAAFTKLEDELLPRHGAWLAETAAGRCALLLLLHTAHALLHGRPCGLKGIEPGAACGRRKNYATVSNTSTFCHGACTLMYRRKSTRAESVCMPAGPLLLNSQPAEVLCRMLSSERGETVPVRCLAEQQPNDAANPHAVPISTWHPCQGALALSVHPPLTCPSCPHSARLTNKSSISNDQPLAH